MSEWISVARIVRPRGLKGELIAEDYHGDWERLRAYPRFVLIPPGREVEIESLWLHNNRLVVKFRGINSLEEAESCRDAELAIPSEDRPPPEPGETYLSDLTGCRVIERANGQELGVVTGCLDYGGSILLQVDAGGKEILVPFVPAVCPIVDVENKRIETDLPQGLKEL